MTSEAGLLHHSSRFEYPQLKTRCVILAATNQESALRDAVAMLLAKYGSGIAAQETRKHIQMLRQKYPEAMSHIE